MSKPIPDGYHTVTPSFTFKDSTNCLKSAETLGSSPISLYVYAPDADAMFKQAVAAGGTATMPVAEMFWGDRVGQIKDPFGYLWMIGTHTQDLTHDEIRKGAEAFFAKAGRP